MNDLTGAWWRTLLADAVDRLQLSGVASPEADARWIGEEASGRAGPAFTLARDEPVPPDQAKRFEEMVARRLAGEPVQYVLGSWAFRTLDLLVDRRVLIPRPETEQVVEEALSELDRFGRQRATVVDLGCGTGAIGLSIATEREGVDVWCVDVSTDAIAVTTENLSRLRARLTGRSVTVVEGSWLDALPSGLGGAVDLIVTNPPYVGASEDLPAEVADWEPVGALVAGPTGREAIERIIEQAPGWLAAAGVLVSEIGSTQGAQVAGAARRAGFADVQVRRDLTGRDRTLVARRS